MVAIFAFHVGKPVVDVAAVQIPVNDLLNIRSPESVLSYKLLIFKLTYVSLTEFLYRPCCKITNELQIAKAPY